MASGSPRDVGGNLNTSISLWNPSLRARANIQIFNFLWPTLACLGRPSQESWGHILAKVPVNKACKYFSEEIEWDVYVPFLFLHPGAASPQCILLFFLSFCSLWKMHSLILMCCTYAYGFLERDHLFTKMMVNTDRLHTRSVLQSLAAFFDSPKNTYKSCDSS